MRIPLFISCLLLGWLSYGQNIEGPPKPTFERFTPVNPGTNHPTTPVQQTIEDQPTQLQQFRSDQFAGDDLLERTTKPTEYRGPFRFDTENEDAAPAKHRFRQASAELDRMIVGPAQPSLAHAVYVMEQAVAPSGVSEQEFMSMLDLLSNMIVHYVEQRGMDRTSTDALHTGIQAMFTDTLTDPLTGKKLLPLRYDFNDFEGREDPANMFVIKLLLLGTGQCRSMPLLYLLLAERLGLEAYWAFGPNHSYVKYPDEHGLYQNFETTSARLVSDAWLAGNGFITSEAIKNRMYLDTVGARRSIAHLQSELALFYQQYFGFSEAFMEQSLQRSLEHFPENMHALLLLSDYETALLDREAHRAGRPPIHSIPSGSALDKRYAKVQALYDHIDALGYREMPQGAYKAWVRSVAEERQRRLQEELNRPVELQPSGR